MPIKAKSEPNGRAGFLSDCARFIVRSPAEQTFLDLSQPGRREIYDSRVLERLGVNVAEADVLNIHRIGIEAPPEIVWSDVAKWNPDAGYLPERIVRCAWEDENHERGGVRLLGLSFLPLFRLNLVRRQDVPPPNDPDHARYVLYRCSGGYPMGVFSIYIRSRIAAEGEVEPTQMFFMVSFDFFGKKHWLGARAVRPVWESVHNRVTAQILNRFKAYCQRGPVPKPRG